VHHPDAGSQYTSFDKPQTLDDHGVLASIGSVGDADDNAPAESLRDLASISSGARETPPQLASAGVSPPPIISSSLDGRRIQARP
jgi:transposase InsO family protein